MITVTITGKVENSVESGVVGGVSMRMFVFLLLLAGCCHPPPPTQWAEQACVTDLHNDEIPMDRLMECNRMLRLTP